MLQTFWTNLISSIYNPAFYSEVLEGEKKRTSSFVFLFSLLAGVAACAFIYLPASMFRGAVEHAPKYVNEVYPEAMVLTVSPAGELSVAGVAEPVYIKSLSQMLLDSYTSMREIAPESADRKYLAVIDTQTAYTPELHVASGAVVWVGKTFITADGGRDADRRMYAYIDMMRSIKEPIVVTKTDADRAARAIAGFAGYIVPIAMVATLIFTTLIYMFGMLVFGVIIGAMVWICANKLQVGVLRVGGADVSYVAAMRVAIFAGVLPSIVMLVSWFTPATLTYGMYTLATLLIVFINTRGGAAKK